MSEIWEEMNQPINPPAIHEVETPSRIVEFYVPLEPGQEIRLLEQIASYLADQPPTPLVSLSFSYQRADDIDDARLQGILILYSPLDMG